MKCPKCGTENDPGAGFCDQCGEKLMSAPMSPAPPVQPPAFQQGPVAPAFNQGQDAGNMVICPQCQTPNIPGTAYCDTCGAQLGALSPAPSPGPVAPSYTPPAPTPQPPFQPPATPSYTPPTPAYPPPAVGGQPPAGACLTIGGQQVVAPVKGEVVVGRADLASGWNPDLDLTPYGGTPDAGVSRKHFRLVWQSAWMIADLNSVNGTYVRGQRLVPNQLTPLTPGDTIQIGKMQLTFAG